MVSLKSRIQGIFFVAISAIVLEGWLGMQSLNNIRQQIQLASEQWLPLNRAIFRLETVQTQQHNQFAKALPDETSPDWVVINNRILQDQMLRIRKELERGNTLIALIRKAAFLPEREIDSIVEQLNAIHTRHDAINHLLDQNLLVRSGGYARLPSSVGLQLIDATEAIEIETGDLLEDVQEQLAAIMTDILTAREEAVTRIIASLSACIMIALLVSRHVSRSVLTPLATADEMAHKIARGELDLPRPRHALSCVASDEIGQLPSFNKLHTMAIKRR
ncbi:MAG: hypothetical protein HQM04_18640, partial [Magnetococcales bacterium]|nr:hypothetical protein [Magnetococcales bacterium]MBF0117048.1 hypothetical protein [Magnetococcales bacterium]